MRFSNLFVIALASTEVVVASTWFPGSKTAYNKWHETELERWLSDHDVPYPAASDRKDLELLVKNNWQANVVDPLAKAGDKSTESYGSVKDWIFDSWTESSLKSFLDHNGISSPQPRTRDTLLTSARQNYDAVAKKSSQYSAYPGDWLYSTWSESDLKEFLDSRGYPAPQPTTRDKLIASVRRNARLASLNLKGVASAASASALSGASVASASVSSGASVVSDTASSGAAYVSDTVFDTWSDSKIKEFLDEHGIPIPQGSKKNELIALARKHRASLTGNAASTASSSGVSAYGAATSKAGNQFAKATDNAQASAEDIFDSAVGTWSESRLKAYLDSRGIPVPQGGKKDQLLASVRLNKHKAASGWSAWTFDTWTTENLQKYLSANNKKYKKNAKATRDDLLKQAQDSYYSASKSGGSNYASATNYLAQQTAAAKGSTFDTWSESELKSYLDYYGVPNYQGSTLNELRAEAKKQSSYFTYGTSTPQGTIFERVKGGFQWIFGLAQASGASASVQASSSATSAASRASNSVSSAKGEL